VLRNYWTAYLTARRLRGYRPRSVTFAHVRDWFGQFPKRQHAALRTVLGAIQFVDEGQMIMEMRQLNERLLARLQSKGVDPSHVIYVQFHEAGSSSAAVLNLVRDACRLENRHCRFVDANDALGLHKTTSDLGSGAIVYVDDFVGTGNQFSKVRAFIAQQIVGTFSEFLLVHGVCEEGIAELGHHNAVEPVPVRVHGRTERPLHELCSILPDDVKEELRNHCLRLSPAFGLGFRRLASMVVYYRNAPNTVPVLLRGTIGQVPLRGIVPRTTDLDAA
jgi:hypothetical protein